MMTTTCWILWMPPDPLCAVVVAVAVPAAAIPTPANTVTAAASTTPTWNL